MKKFISYLILYYEKKKRFHRKIWHFVSVYTCINHLQVYNQVTRWQMRASILWARDLLSVNQSGARPFARVAISNRCQETAIVENTANPIWNETLIFEEVFAMFF